jgi:small GTP-binding protein
MDLKKKICMIGGVGVGKTCLVRRFVSGVFSDVYIATVGVKIDLRTVRVGGRRIDLVIWDIAGGDASLRSVPAYFAGSSAYIVVMDGTDPRSVRAGRDARLFAEDVTGALPCATVLNKADLAGQWSVPADAERELAEACPVLIKTSAKTGQAVSELFTTLAGLLVRESGHEHIRRIEPGVDGIGTQA